MSNEQTQDQVRERKRDVLKRPFRQGLHWVGSRLEEFRSRTASPRSTRPSTPQQTELLPADAAPSPRNRDQLLDVPVLLSNLAPGQETLLPSTSVSPAPIDHFNQGDPAPPPPEMSRHQELDIRVESPRPDILQAPTLVLSNESIVSSHHPSQEISAQNPSQALEVTTFPSQYDTQNDNPPVLRDSSADQVQDRPLEKLSLNSPPTSSLRPLHHDERLDKELLRTVNYGPVSNIGAAENVFSGVNHVTMIADNDFTTSYLDKLKVSIRADHMYHPSGEESVLRRDQCIPGTRVNIIQGVASWATNPSLCSELVYWLSGQAGAGKTTIAYTIACLFENLIGTGDSKAILGGSFFCSRQFPDTRSTSAIIRTIVYQLALRSKAFRAALKECGRLETVNHGPRSQLMGLLIEPWKISAPGRLVNDEPCYVLPVDALDELDGESGAEFLGILFDILEQEDLSGLKFFITSRPHPALVDRIKSFSSKQVCRLEEVPLNESSADIKVYLDANLARCATPEQIQQLVSDAAGLFIYAATVVKYVKGRGIEEQRKLLDRLLLTSPSSHQRPRNATATLDSLYLQILETCLVDPRDRGDPDVFQGCLSILHTFLCTIERTSASVAVAILQEGSKQSEIDNGTAEGVLLRLHAVLYIQDGQVLSFHKSFSDFLFDQRRSNEFYCNQEQLHHRLAVGCFQIMAQQLRFNIADIPMSYQMDGDNPGLLGCMDTNISAALRYACRNWSAHLVLSPLEAIDCFTKPLHLFLQLKILFWMESMNLLQQRGWCQHMLRNAQQWFSKSKGPTELTAKLADAVAFAAYHSASKAALSTPHLYLSSLATFSRCSTVVQGWRQQFGGIPRFTSAHSIEDKALVAHIPLRSEVNTLAISPDSVNIAVGSPDGCVQVLNLSTGEDLRVLKGHTSRVNAVAYSPEGSHVVSGSGDKSIRVWDVATGEEVKIFEGHTDWVKAVAYSPDGSHVVSGSDDKSIRVWDVATGEEVKIFEGHTHWVGAVAYSPHGSHVVSGSADKSIRVWDVATGEEVKIFEGHTHWVGAVAYSPHGSHVVSGSADKSIRVWDVATGEVRVFEGHTDWVSAVACSPDGSYVVSGSKDQSVRVWNISPEDMPCYIRHRDLNEQYTGWLVSPADPSAYLMYVRPEALLPDASNILTMPTLAVPHLDFSNAKLGDRWAECYTPQSF